MIHTCGSSSWAYEDFIEMGIDAVDTLQPEAEGHVAGVPEEDASAAGWPSTAASARPGPVRSARSDETDRRLPARRWRS